MIAIAEKQRREFLNCDEMVETDCRGGLRAPLVEPMIGEWLAKPHLLNSFLGKFVKFWSKHSSTL